MAAAESEIQLMAGNLPVPQGLEAKLVWSRAGIPYALTILHFRHAVGQLHDQTRANTLDTLCKTALTSSGHGANLHTSVALARVESRHMDSNSDPWFIGAGAPVAGTATGDLLPLANAFVVTSKTGLRGRSFNGRTYLMGFAEGVNDSAGQITAAAAAAAVNFVGFIVQDAATQLSLTRSILSRWTTPPTAPPNTPPTERNPPILTPVTLTTNLDLRWDVQRRRAVPGI